MPDEKNQSDDLADALGDLGGEPVDQADQSDTDATPLSGSSSSRSRRRKPGTTSRSRANRGPTQLARHGVKVCLVIGMLLLIPALWAVAILIDLPVPMSGRKSATAMALLMLLCWPIAGALIWGSFHFAKQHAKFDALQAGD